MKLLVTKRAEAQLLTTFEWLEENVGVGSRQKLEGEVEQAFTALKATPFIGPKARDVRTKGVHRLYLPKAEAFLYYRVDEKRREVQVLRYWHSHRGRPPKL